MKRFGAGWTAMVLVFFLCAAPAQAERPSEGLGQWLQEVGVVGAYAYGSLKGDRDFDVASLGVRFGFDLIPFTKKFGLEPPGMLEIIYEPTIGLIMEPDQNVEFGLPIFFRYAYPLTQKLYPYVEVGSGPYYYTLHTYEQSTQFNFISAGGAGLIYFLRDDLAVNAGYRRRHVSNASIKEPNGGIDADVITVGVSWYF
jgi:lipid A 3-O-deacylase